MAQRKTLLIVDDDRDLRGAIAEQLQAEGFETVEVGSAGEGVQAARDAKPDEKQKKIRLTEKETNILKYLYRAGEKPVSREELLAEVWGYNAGVTTHTLETHVYRLRQKIEPDPANARLLLTEAGGYKLTP